MSGQQGLRQPRVDGMANREGGALDGAPPDGGVAPDEVWLDDAPAWDDAAVLGDVVLIMRDAPPISELNIRMIADSLHDQGRGHVLPDMIEAMTGVRPPDEDFSPRKLPIRDPQWREARKKVERRKYRAKRRENMTEEDRAERIKKLKSWKADNPEKMKAVEVRRLENKKEARKSREFVAVDLEGFNTGRYFTDDRRDHVRDYHEAFARCVTSDELERGELDHLLKNHFHLKNEGQPFAGWMRHDHKWYLDQHDLTEDLTPSARNKKPGTPPIYIEHRPFLFGAGNDREQYFLTEDGEESHNRNGNAKKALSAVKLIFNSWNL